MTSETDPLEAFHLHLEGCKQCERHPFDLCIEGARIMEECAKNLPVSVSDEHVPADWRGIF